MEEAFWGCSNLNDAGGAAPDSPDLSKELIKQVDLINDWVDYLLWWKDFAFVKPFVNSRIVSYKYTIGTEKWESLYVYIWKKSYTFDEFKKHIEKKLDKAISYNSKVSEAFISLYNGIKRIKKINWISVISIILNLELLKPKIEKFDNIYDNDFISNNSNHHKVKKKEKPFWKDILPKDKYSDWAVKFREAMTKK